MVTKSATEGAQHAHRGEEQLREADHQGHGGGQEGEGELHLGHRDRQQDAVHHGGDPPRYYTIV